MLVLCCVMMFVYNVFVFHYLLKPIVLLLELLLVFTYTTAATPLSLNNLATVAINVLTLPDRT